jgi:hypothetical protein
MTDLSSARWPSDVLQTTRTPPSLSGVAVTMLGPGGEREPPYPWIVRRGPKPRGVTSCAASDSQPFVTRMNRPPATAMSDSCVEPGTCVEGRTIRPSRSNITTVAVLLPGSVRIARKCVPFHEYLGKTYSGSRTVRSPLRRPSASTSAMCVRFSASRQKSTIDSPVPTSWQEKGSGNGGMSKAKERGDSRVPLASLNAPMSCSPRRPIGSRQTVRKWPPEYATTGVNVE